MNLPRILAAQLVIWTCCLASQPLAHAQQSYADPVDFPRKGRTRATTDGNPKIQIHGKQALLARKLAEAYRQLQRGELEDARETYHEALAEDPQNIDCLLALAAIAWQRGKRSESREFWQQALASDPGDPEVQAAILASPQASLSLKQSESRLHNLLAAYPESAALHFALGNLLAREKRWTAAGQAFANALSIDGDNPDYLYNLAISHEHLRQTSTAKQRYREALAAGEYRAAAFDKAQTHRRLQELEP